MLIENAGYAGNCDAEDRKAEPVRIAGDEVSVTGPFLHAKSQRKNMFFRSSGDVTRSFTIVLALAKSGEDGNPDFNKNGIAVIDNDNIAVLIDGICPQTSGIGGASMRQVKAFDLMANMSWQEFTTVLHAHEYYQGVAGDIDQIRQFPDAGDFDRQVMLGLKRPEDRDFRDGFMKSINDDGLYSLPAISRMGMINQILMHPTTKLRDGIALSWDVRMNFSWDSSGHVQDGDDLDRKYDARWKMEIAKNDEVFEEVCDIAIGPYLSDEFSVLDLEDSACGLEAIGPNNGTVIMRSWKGRDYVCENIRELREDLITMPDDDLRSLWMTVRVLDQDFCKKQRIEEMQIASNKVRARLEPEWAQELEEELNF